MANHVAEQWSDAVIRAFRTFYTSVGIDILVAIGVGLNILLSGGDVLSPVFWMGVLALVARSTVTGIATYFARLKLPPSNTTPTL